MIPVWGSARQSWNDFALARQTGDWTWGLVGVSNAYLAVTEAVGIGYIAKGVAKGALKLYARCRGG